MSGRETIYIFPRLEGHGHRLRGRDRAGMAQHPNDVRTTVGALLADGWGVAAADHGYLLLRRARRQRRCHPPSTRRGRRICCRRPVTMCALRRRSLCWATRSRPETPQSGRLVTTLYLRGRASPTDLGVYIAYLDRDGVPIHDSLFYPPVATLWYPTTSWTPGRRWQLRTLPWTLGADAFTLAVGLYDCRRKWTDGPRAVADARRQTGPGRRDVGAAGRLPAHTGRSMDDAAAGRADPSQRWTPALVTPSACWAPTCRPRPRQGMRSRLR
ncbi:MAG: hypothetical protein R3A10_08520 [Caldilineaceae bacterium]